MRVGPLLRGRLGERGSRAGGRSILVAAIGLMPSCSLKTLLMRHVLGWDIDKTARVGPCIFWDVKEVVLQRDAIIGGYCMFLHVAHLSLGEGAIIGYWNWLAAAPSLRTPTLDARSAGWAARLELGHHAAITSRHYVDCSGGVAMGSFTVVGGVRSTILTHQVDTTLSEQSLRRVSIGSYCLVGSNVQVVPGACIPDRSVVAMGSVVAGVLQDAGSLYGGVPARRIRATGDGAYFERRTGFAEIP